MSDAGAMMIIDAGTHVTPTGPDASAGPGPEPVIDAGPADPCRGVVCNSPPSPCYRASGSCSGGRCIYSFADRARCDDGDDCTTDDFCLDGSCHGNAMRCDTPPAAVCASSTTLRTWSTGTCSSGRCSYAPTERRCPSSVCEENACVEATEWSPLVTSGMPGARYQHSAVWTGSAMLVWGGYGGSVTAITNDVAALNLATGVWTRSTGTSAPLARRGHTALWTGSSMLVWGGNAGGVLAAPTAYDPVLNRWSTLSQYGAMPLPRQGHSAVWDSTTATMMIWSGGGPSVLGERGRSGAAMSSAGFWSELAMSGAPEGRSFHSAVWTGSEMIVWGGASTTRAFADGGRYDPRTATWTPISSIGAPSARYGHSTIWTGTEMVIWGGQSFSGVPLSDGARFDPATNVWTPISAIGAPSARWGHSAVWTGTEMIVWGGTGTSGGPFADGGRWRP